MDWNQDPNLLRLEEKLDRIAERLDLIEETMGQPKRFYSIVIDFVFVLSRNQEI